MEGKDLRSGANSEEQAKGEDESGDVSSQLFAQATDTVGSAKPNGVAAVVDQIVCPLCAKVFTGSKRYGGLQSNYNRHLLTHSGDRPHQCTSCDMTFTTSSNLRRHEAKRHREQHPSAAMDVEATAVASGGIALPLPPQRDAAVSFVCRNGCGREFSWRATRTIHERRCREEKAEMNPSTTAESIGHRPQSASPSQEESAAARRNVHDNKEDAHLLPPQAPPPTSSPPPLSSCGGVVSVVVECPDCEAPLASRSKLARHQRYHCPFRANASGARCDSDDDDVHFFFKAGGGGGGARWMMRDEVPLCLQQSDSDTAAPPSRRRTRHDPRGRRRHHVPCPHCEGLFRNARLLELHMRRRHVMEVSSNGMGGEESLLHSGANSTPPPPAPSSQPADHQPTALRVAPLLLAPLLTRVPTTMAVLSSKRCRSPSSPQASSDQMTVVREDLQNEASPSPLLAPWTPPVPFHRGDVESTGDADVIDAFLL